MTRDNAYRLLGLTSSATEQEIGRAFKKLAMKHHPDHGGNPENFKLLLEAKNILLTKEPEYKYNINGRKFTKSEYDEILKKLREQREFLSKIHKEQLDELNSFNKTDDSIYSKSIKIKIYIWVAFILKLTICASIGYFNLGFSLISAGIFILLLYNSTAIARLHTAYINYKKLK